jgi:GT2 family glycosyltransferase
VSESVEVVIPHLRGAEILHNCLESIKRSGDPDVSVILVDNASDDGSVDAIAPRFPFVRVVRSETNLGYAGGCNLGIREGSAPLVALLNDDTEVDPGWLGPIRRSFSSEELLGACQPKLLSLREPGVFDYAGAAGGLIDALGYPFARGRVFDSLERDDGQYDEPAEIFWASGAACVFRRSALDEVGLLDEGFFAHMEEIDLCWRLHMNGWRVMAEPSSVVRHWGAVTLGTDHPRKLELNHRNNIWMIAKNASAATLLWLHPLRFLLDWLTAFRALLTGRSGWALAVARAHLWLATNTRVVWAGRHSARRVRKVPDGQVRRLFQGVLPWAHFVRRKTVLSEVVR